MRPRKPKTLHKLDEFISGYQSRYSILEKGLKDIVIDNCIYARKYAFRRESIGDTVQQEMLAKAMGSNFSTIYRLEKKEKSHEEGYSHRIDLIFRYAAFFDVPVECFFVKNGIVGMLKKKDDPWEQRIIEVQKRELTAIESVKAATFTVDGNYCKIILPDNTVKRLKLGKTLKMDVNGEDFFDVAFIKELSDDNPFIIFDYKDIVNVKFIATKADELCPERFSSNKNICSTLSIVVPVSFVIGYTPYNTDKSIRDFVDRVKPLP